MRKLLAGVVLFVLVTFVTAQEMQAPTWKGLVCMGWTKPYDKSLVDGDVEGDEMVVNTPLTKSEKQELFSVRRAAHEAFAREEELQKEIIKSHGYKVGGTTGSEGPCGEFVMIRMDEYHITQFVPSNPAYPGTGEYSNFLAAGKSAADCRVYFANLRKKATAASYGVKEQP